MTSRRVRSRKRPFNFRHLMIIFLILFVVLFLREIWDILRLMLNVLVSFLGVRLEITRDTLTSIWTLGYNCLFGFLFVLLIWLFIAGPVVLPVRGFSEVRRAPVYLFLHIMGWHGPRLFVENGKVISNPEGMSPKWPGVIVLDANSAIALEAGVRMADVSSPARRMVPALLQKLGLTDRRENVRVRGPGVVFTWPEEEIHAVLDMRRQFRIQPGNNGYTRDGIEVTSPVWVIFTIGQDPAILDVTYQGDQIAENLRMVTVRELPNGNFLVEKLEDELDPADQAEAHQFARRPMVRRAMQPFTPAPNTTLNMQPSFDPERVFSAAFGQALFQGEMLPWHDLPLRVAVDFFREELSRLNFQDMYNPNLAASPFAVLRSRLARAVRNNGILACRVVLHRDGKPLQPGVEYAPGEVIVSQVLNFSNPKVLRERGIKVIAAGLPELRLPDVMYTIRLDYWKSQIDSEARIVESRAEFLAKQEQNRARAEAQEDMVRVLNEILGRGGTNQEAILWSVLQSLEQAALDPKTQRLLPEHTISTLNMLRDWVVPGSLPPGTAVGPMLPGTPPTPAPGTGGKPPTPPSGSGGNPPGSLSP